MTTRQQVIDSMVKDRFYEDVLYKYLSNSDERDEFRQELWLIILEMKEEKLISYYDSKCLKYIYIGIINNQLKSSTSPWHRKHRMQKAYNFADKIDTGGSGRGSQFNNDNFKSFFYESADDYESSLFIKEDFERKIEYIESKLVELESKDPYLHRDITIFRMHFYDGMSYRKIALKTHICLVSVWKYINNVIFLLQKDQNKIK